MTFSRRNLIALAAAALPVSDVFAAAPSDAPAGKIYINTLGSLNNPNVRSKASDGEELPNPDERTLKEAHASGVTAINITLGYVSGTADPFETTVASIARADEVIRTNAKDLLKVFTAADIRRAQAEKKVGIIFNVQNCAMLGNKADRVSLFADLGLRCFQLTYNFENALGGGSNAPAIGLTPFGQEVVEHLNAKRMIVDLAHSGRQICLDAARVSKQPIAITHTGCRALFDIARNKSDEELRAVGEKGGYVGIFTGGMFLFPGRESTAEDVVKHIEHAIDICGEDHVGVGTDNPITGIDDVPARRAGWKNAAAARAKAGIGAEGEASGGLPFTEELLGPDQFRVLARTMEKRGHSAARIDKVLGLNFLRFAQDVWGA